MRDRGEREESERGDEERERERREREKDVRNTCAYVPWARRLCSEFEPQISIAGNIFGQRYYVL